MDTAQWPQEIVVKPIEDIVTCPKAASSGDRKEIRPQKEQALNCPRCNSTNTKFCYYNNYSLTQPRYFCKTCRRYWTEGGSLRNIPVGGGSRKNKRSSSSSLTTSSSSKKLPDLVTPPISLSHSSSSSQNPNNSKIHEGQDLNLAFPSTQGIRSFSELIQVPSINEGNSKNHPCTSQLSALELLTGISSRGLNSFIPMQTVQDPNSSSTVNYTTSSCFPPLQDFKPTLNFSLDGGVCGGFQGVHQDTSSGGRLLFPFEDLKQVSSPTTTDIEPNREHAGDSTGYWTGMLGGSTGGSW